MLLFVLLLFGFFGLVVVEFVVYFKEQFLDGDGWIFCWIEFKYKLDFGKFVFSFGKFYGDEEKDKGLQISQDVCFYVLLVSFEFFSNKGQMLVVQFMVKYEQNIDCGGGYVKLFFNSLDQIDMYGDLEYNIMFGFDICGFGIKKVYVIFNYKGKNVLINKDICCKDDEFIYLYILIVWLDNIYEVKIDNSQVEFGFLEDDWDFLLFKKIKDFDVLKLEDWDEWVKIDDFIDFKFEDWDKFEYIFDFDVKKFEDWDEEMDGEWEFLVIQNFEYKGEWKFWQIDNLDYKGIWIYLEIDNFEYFFDFSIYVYDNFGVLGLDFWQVKFGIIFDNFFIINDEVYVEEFGNEMWGVIKVVEK